MPPSCLLFKSAGCQVLWLSHSNSPNPGIGLPMHALLDYGRRRAATLQSGAYPSAFRLSRFGRKKYPAQFWNRVGFGGFGGLAPEKFVNRLQPASLLTIQVLFVYPVANGSAVGKTGRHKFTQWRIADVLTQLHRHLRTSLEG